MERAAHRLMTRPIYTLLLLGSALAGLGMATPAARATSVTYDNNTEVAYYNGTSPQEQGGGVYWDNTPSNGGIGGEPTFYTPSVTIGMTTSGSGATETSKITISFSTGLYTGSTNVGGTNVYAADIFLGSASSSPTGSYTYAISLGFDSADGGYSSAGLYKLPTTGASSDYKTSQQVWGSRTSYTYGGAYAQVSGGGSCGVSVNPTSCAAANVSPTVLLNNDGSGVSSSSVTVSGNNTSSGSADGTLTVTISGLTSVLAPIFDDFDLFWGTGDCSNAPIWEDVSLATKVAEPSTLALMASALAFAAAMARRRRRAAMLA
jgi:hypothetical protein